MRNVILWCFFIIFLAGNIIGLSIGYTPIIIQSYNDGTDCANLVNDKDACDWSSKDHCRWDKINQTCEFAPLYYNNISCTSLLSQEMCEQQENDCIWTARPSEPEKSCYYQIGWKKTFTALVGALAAIGGLVASLFVNLSITKAGVNNTIALAGIMSTVACIFLICGWRSYDADLRVALILIGRFFSGVCIGLASAAVPIYIGDVAPRENVGVLGVGFQVFITFGIMCASLAGLGSNPTLTDLHSRTGVQILNIYQLVLSILLVPVGFFAEKPLFDDSVRNSLLTFRNSAFLRIEQGGGKDGTSSNSGFVGALGESASLFKRPLYVAVAVLLAGGQQLSGINALMSYSSEMASDIGLTNPFLATFVISAWNFVSTLVAIYFAYRMSAGKMFLVGEFITALSCFVVAVPIYLGNTQDATSQALIITGVVLFIFAFEFGLGPSFYPLSVAVYPTEVRSAGCSFTIFCQFFFSLLVQFLYPILVSSFSGGPSKPQDKGIAINFFIYGALGLILTCTLKKVMQLIEDDLAEPGEEIGGPVETRDGLTQY